MLNSAEGYQITCRFSFSVIIFIHTAFPCSEALRTNPEKGTLNVCLTQLNQTRLHIDNHSMAEVSSLQMRAMQVCLIIAESLEAHKSAGESWDRKNILS